MYTAMHFTQIVCVLTMVTYFCVCECVQSNKISVCAAVFAGVWTVIKSCKFALKKEPEILQLLYP